MGGGGTWETREPIRYEGPLRLCLGCARVALQVGGFGARGQWQGGSGMGAVSEGEVRQ